MSMQYKHIIKAILVPMLGVVGLYSYAQYRQPIGFLLPKESTTIDSAYLKCTYRLMSVKDTIDPDKSTFEDIQTLQIGPHVSKFFSQYLLDHLRSAQTKADKGARGIERNPHRGSYAYEVFTNYPKQGTVTVADLGSFLINTVNFAYEEPTPAIWWQWTMTQCDSILGYPCVKATASFRGRDYSAWFTLALPIGLGPWKFGGLPGLILKISDSQNHYVWECIGIERLVSKEPIVWRKIKFTPVSRSELDVLYRRCHKDEAMFLKSLGAKYANDPNRRSDELPYNPIELE